MNQANDVLARCKRFSRCLEKVQLQLYKRLIRPILEYPPIPLNTLSNSRLLTLQTIQNKALTWAEHARYPNIPLAQHLHEYFNIKPMNIRIHELANKTWGRLETLKDSLYNSLQGNTEIIHPNQSHKWWPKSLPLRPGNLPYLFPTKHASAYHTTAYTIRRLRRQYIKEECKNVNKIVANVKSIYT